MPDVHGLLSTWRAILIYAGEWQYLPNHSVLRIRRGRTRFSLPWPLVQDVESEITPPSSDR